jgi:2-oxoglutarate ferredoxin oxidoreductase subunit beta
MSNKVVEKYFRKEMMPHIFCPGCGHGVLMKDIAIAIDRLGYDKNNVCIVSGIGCSSRAAGYMDFNTIHTTHGRAIAVATGMKMAKPNLKVIVITGDGDASAIGGNHFIHAARRNINLAVFVFNNNIYGMTGGQYSPTTPMNDYGTTAPYGNIDQSFDIADLAKYSGATFVARGTVWHVDKTIRLMERAILHKGFSVVDCMSVCPTYYGRKNQKGGSVDMIKWQRKYSVDSAKAKNMTREELEGKLIIGEIHHRNREEYTVKYKKILDMFKEE